jgi:hypothetical protein
MKLSVSVLCLSLLPGALVRAQVPQTNDLPAATARQLAIEGRILRNPGSLCDLARPRRPQQLIWDAGASTTIRGCRDLDTLRLTPVWLTVRNRDTMAVAFRLPPPESLSVAVPGGARPAVALWMDPGGRAGFATGVSGISVPLEPDATIELLYLVPRPQAPTRLRIRGFGTVTLRTP